MGKRDITPNAYLGKTASLTEGKISWAYPETMLPPKGFMLEGNPVSLDYWAWLSYKNTGDNMAWAKFIVSNPADFPLVQNIFSTSGYPGVYPRLSFARKLREVLTAGGPVPSGQQSITQQIALSSGVNSVVTSPTPTTMQTVKYAPTVTKFSASTAVDPVGIELAGVATPVITNAPGVAPANNIITTPDYSKISPPMKSTTTTDPGQPLPPADAPQTAGFDVGSAKAVGGVVAILIVMGFLFGKGGASA
jgi:hypothetical protein